MKQQHGKLRFISLLTVLLMLSGNVCWAKSPRNASTSEPQDIGVLLYLTGRNFVPLELQTAIKQDRSLIFSATTEEFLAIPGAKSPVRFKTNAAIVLYLRVFLDESDPRAGFFPLRDPNRFRLVRLENDGEQRKITLVKSGLTYTKRQLGHPLLVRLYGEHSFQLSPSEALAPGEYAIKYERDENESEADQFDLFCFGIDG